ncbi:MAG: hypothetical protein LBT09_04800 [Planctomycetaceae bacterium]|jgi:hypothetical protein|nr:hypothetical protein [Planctomycetaceae bacterium]
MAIIAKLALKISADIGDLTKNAQDVISSVNNIAKVARNATPSIKNLEDASKGYSISLDAIQKAQARVKNSNGAINLDDIAILREAEKAVEQLKNMEIGL